MKNNFIVSTTNNIENAQIRKYIDVVCINIVVGANVFSDIAASWTDFWGGKSKSYQRKLEYIYDEALSGLKQKALKIGGNAILGFRVDFDEISGRDKCMFMVSASGTACLVDYDGVIDTPNDMNYFVYQEDIDKEVMRRTIINQLINGEDVKKDWVTFLVENKIEKLINPIIELYIKNKKTLNDYETSDILKKILSSYDKDKIVPIIYSKWESEDFERYIIPLIKELSLFDAKSILEICKKNLHRAIKLLPATSQFYNSEEISYMNDIVSFFSNLPNTGKIEKVKSGIFSKSEKEMFICCNGHKNNLNTEYCLECFVNIKGLDVNETEAIKMFKEKVEIIKELVG